MIFFALSSINSKSLSSNFTSSKIIYLALLNISSNVFALFLRKINEGLIFVSFSGLIFSYKFHNILQDDRKVHFH